MQKYPISDSSGFHGMDALNMACFLNAYKIMYKLNILF